MKELESLPIREMATPWLEVEADPRQGEGAPTSWRLVWREFRKNRPALVGAVVVLILIGVALAAPWIAPHDPAQINPFPAPPAPGVDARRELGVPSGHRPPGPGPPSAG